MAAVILLVGKGTCLARAKRLQHTATLLGTTCCVHLAMPQPLCCDMLGVVGLSLKMVKFKPECHNAVAKRTQHVAPKNVALACCNGLPRALSLNTA